MKRRDVWGKLQALSLSDLQKEIFDLEQQIQEQRFLIALNKTKQVRTPRMLRRKLAQSLTLAQTKIAQIRKEKI
jgi:hypothetical protein